MVRHDLTGKSCIGIGAKMNAGACVVARPGEVIGIT